MPLTTHASSTRYPITAYAVCNALGLDNRSVRDRLGAGHTGLTPADTDPHLALDFETCVGRIDSPLRPVPDALGARDTRQARIALHTLDALRPALDDAIARWGAHRIAILVGTSTGGIGESEAAMGQYFRTGALPPDYDLLGDHAFYAVTDLIAAATGIGGPRYLVSTACTSSAKVLGAARRLLDLGLVDAALVGGVDSLCRFTVAGFDSLQVLAHGPCRPFSEQRTGINIGEAGALMLVERTGDPRAWLLGVGETSDAWHMTTPHPEGTGAIAAMRQALADAGLQPGDVDHLNAHATATRVNDIAESQSIAAVFGRDLPVVSTKGYTGHTLGACGATEAVFAIMSLEQGLVPACVGADPLDPEIDALLDVATSPRQAPLRVVASNSFAFGGNNICLVLGAADAF